MANHTVRKEVEAQVIELYSSSGSILQTARQAGVCRNTVRRILRVSGLTHHPKADMSVQVPFSANPTAVPPSAPAMDFQFIERLFDLGKDHAENVDFKRQIIVMANAMAAELGINGNAVDLLRLETAVLEYLTYRRFYLKSLTATQASYQGPYAKVHDKLARAVDRWTSASQKSLQNFTAIIKDIEIKHRIRIPQSGNSVFFTQNAVNLTTQTVREEMMVTISRIDLPPDMK